MIILFAVILFILISILVRHNKEGFESKYKYTAIIIEPREHPALEFVLQNFNDNLSDEWKFIIYHGSKNGEYAKNIANKIFEKDKVSFVNLNVENLDRYTYSALFFDKSFYDNITEHFLVFQTDSIICSKHKDLIDNFLNYDYVGAPWMNDEGVGNGGLSLRKKSKMLEIISKCKHKDENNNYVMEDRLFSDGCNDIPIYKPSVEEAKEFAIEGVLSNKSFGLHKSYDYLDSESIKSIQGWCPEINQLTKLNKNK
jgi:hypothetical protein